MALKPWSITTTVRNPNRLRDFLVCLQIFVGKKWNSAAQESYQKQLIKDRIYGFGSTQFYNGLSQSLVERIQDPDAELTDCEIDEIVTQKNYTDFAMRGRQSINPLLKFGFAYLDEHKKIRISTLGKRLLSDEFDSEIAYLNTFLKWQISNPLNNDYPNTDDYRIVPFVGTLALIDRVNILCKNNGDNQVGLQKREFALFVPTLTRSDKIEEYAKMILDFRQIQKGLGKTERKYARDEYRKKFVSEFTGLKDTEETNRFIRNLEDYGDNILRYFRLTKFLSIRGGGYYVDLEPKRTIEINSLLDGHYYEARKFESKDKYVKFLLDDNSLHLPWKTFDSLNKILDILNDDIVALEKKLNKQPSESTFKRTSESMLESAIISQRKQRAKLLEELNHSDSKSIDKIQDYINGLENIYESENRALDLEYLTTMGLHALNDSRQIKPNYPLGDDNMPTNTAPGGVADIECYYDNFNMIVEVTMLKSRDQWVNEGQPVMRHLRSFEEYNQGSYCLFIAPQIHTDTIETFSIANKHGYKGAAQKIIPITIKSWINILKAFLRSKLANKIFSHDKLLNLFDDILQNGIREQNSDEWNQNIDNIVARWCDNL